MSDKPKYLLLLFGIILLIIGGRVFSMKKLTLFGNFDLSWFLGIIVMISAIIIVAYCIGKSFKVDDERQRNIRWIAFFISVPCALLIYAFLNNFFGTLLIQLTLNPDSVKQLGEYGLVESSRGWIAAFFISSVALSFVYLFIIQKDAPRAQLNRQVSVEHKLWKLRATIFLTYPVHNIGTDIDRTEKNRVLEDAQLYGQGVAMDILKNEYKSEEYRQLDVMKDRTKGMFKAESFSQDFRDFIVSLDKKENELSKKIHDEIQEVVMKLLRSEWGNSKISLRQLKDNGTSFFSWRFLIDTFSDKNLVAISLVTLEMSEDVMKIREAVRRQNEKITEKRAEAGDEFVKVISDDLGRGRITYEEAQQQIAFMQGLGMLGESANLGNDDSFPIKEKGRKPLRALKTDSPMKNANNLQILESPRMRERVIEIIVKRLGYDKKIDHSLEPDLTEVFSKAGFEDDAEGYAKLFVKWAEKEEHENINEIILTEFFNNYYLIPDLKNGNRSNL